MQQRKNIVLVHGAWADASCWAKVIPLLQAQGHYVSAAQLPLTSLEDDIVVTQRMLAAQKGPTTLVGHSYGGVVISGAATATSSVDSLVYISAFGLDEGESIDLLSKSGPAPAGAKHIFGDDNGYLWIDREGFASAFVADATPAEANVMAVVQKPLSVASFTAKSGPPAWKRLPSWYMVSANDQVIPPAAEAMMGKRMGATVHTIPASHASMIAHAPAVADFILLAAKHRELAAV